MCTNVIYFSCTYMPLQRRGTFLSLVIKAEGSGVYRGDTHVWDFVKRQNKNEQ